jgi:Lipid A 3-O-deacylase (PagL)
MLRSIFFSVIGIFISISAHADRIAFSGGVMTAVDHPPSFVGTAEYRPSFNLLQSAAELHPILGLLSNTQGSVYGYGGLRLGFPLSDTWRYENAVGFGGYVQDNGPDLYCPFEFFLAVSILKNISEKYRVGIQLFHISNAGIVTHDPGSNNYLAVFELPLPGFD